MALYVRILFAIIADSLLLGQMVLVMRAIRLRLTGVN
jgi:hypothetical protein